MTRDLRKYIRQTNTRLIVGGIVILFVVGDGLILLIYGREAALAGLICLFAGLSPIILIWIFLWGMEMIVKISNKE
jgi:hypothetical protein